jgi:polar amino acid transport system substrate-binding protein
LPPLGIARTEIAGVAPSDASTAACGACEKLRIDNLGRRRLVMAEGKTQSWSRRHVVMGGLSLLAAPALLARPALAITPAEIKTRGRLIVGILRDDAPWGYIDQNTKIEGFDAQMGFLFGKELGVPAEFVPLNPSNRSPDLTVGRVDVLFATMVMLPARAQAVQYSQPYAAVTFTMVAAKTTELKSYADIAKLTVGVQRSTMQDAELTRNAPAGAKIVRFDSESATLRALASGDVQAIGGNMFYVERLNKVKPGVYEDKFELTRLYVGACTRLGEKEINAELNAFIDKVRGNGELAEAYTKWLKAPMPDTWPKSVEGVPFAAN